MKKLFFVVVFFLYIILLNSKYYEIEYNTLDNEISNSLIGLTIDGITKTEFPEKESGLAIDSIVCDKGANGVWDYKNWLLKVRNITENRTKCQVNFVTKYTESILNGTDPVLKEGLVPVLISDEGVVTKSSEGWKWYDYENQWWANAVILDDDAKEYYDGDIIPEDDIESYFVWIPRYRYKLFNQDNGNYPEQTTITNKEQIIEIEFENKIATVSNGMSYGEWLTHPAFIAFDTNGMWVGKFETGYKGANSTAEAENNINDSTKIQIKPNVYSWRGIQVANAYLTSYNYKREYDSHMMKNTEWGAVAYLQHSKYGDHERVRINNNRVYLTGYAAKSEPTCGYTATNEDCNKYESTSKGIDGIYTLNYLNSSSVVASTTGNYSGVYDMSGGAWEYVMGVMADNISGNPCSGQSAALNSGFNGTYCYSGGKLIGSNNFPTDKRYFDIYAYGESDEQYNRRIFGDATGEMGPFQTKTYGLQQRQVGSWHMDEAWFIFTSYPWFARGGGHYAGTDAGEFAFFHDHGSGDKYLSFRVVLAF